ncbi:MAG: 2-C-methyl-D-erythritol 4-phosphate cytidylyltransferase [Tidjanibacter sp.]|nr:2-C-methyl-D-erythritol 4-phosphate cytidylyltransferase [Tidjanibacter sp.]
MESRTGVIIVAGGSGTRMGADVPKQFLKVCGKEILVHSVEKFREALPDCDMVIVLPEGEMARWQELAEQYGLQCCKVCAGGANRFMSVKRGLTCVDKSCDLIAVHDAVRPLLSQEMIENTVAVAREYGSAIPVVEVTDTIRMVTREGGAQTVDRSLLRAVQTPQIFDAQTLREAYKTRYSKRFTDDASVYEKYGASLTFCEGERSNIKITTPVDLKIAEALMK